MKCSASKQCQNEATVFYTVTGLPATRGKCRDCYERAVRDSVQRAFKVDLVVDCDKCGYEIEIDVRKSARCPRCQHVIND